MRRIVCWIGLGLLGLGFAQSEEKGKRLFQERCAACHKLHQKLIGPALSGIGQRREKEWFAKFVVNSQALIQAGDKAAVEVYEAYNKQVMPPNPDFSPEDIEALWAYLNAEAAPSESKMAGGDGSAVSPLAAESPQIVYPGEARPLSKEEVGFLRQTFWLLVGITVGVTFLLGLVIQVASTRGRASEEKSRS
jgi:cytochrome c551/c552